MVWNNRQYSILFQESSSGTVQILRIFLFQVHGFLGISSVFLVHLEKSGVYNIKVFMSILFLISQVLPQNRKCFYFNVKLFKAWHIKCICLLLLNKNCKPNKIVHSFFIKAGPITTYALAVIHVKAITF